ncbi:hypothetical protein ACFDTO_25490 [Microbacteriaceae bacterium 4G12]
MLKSWNGFSVLSNCGSRQKAKDYRDSSSLSLFPSHAFSEISVSPHEEAVPLTSTIDENVDVHVMFAVRSAKGKGEFSAVAPYQAGEFVDIRCYVENKGEEEVNHISISHMIRDHLSYVSDTLYTNRGEGSVFFRLVRWLIPCLYPGEKVMLTFQVRMKEEAALSITLGGTYVFQCSTTVQGPFQAVPAFLEK